MSLSLGRSPAGGSDGFSAHGLTRPESRWWPGGLLPGGSGRESASRLTLATGRIQFPVAGGTELPGPLLAPGQRSFSRQEDTCVLRPTGVCVPTFTVASFLTAKIRKQPKMNSPRRSGIWPWLVWLSKLSSGLQTKGSQVRFPVRAHAWVEGWVPSRGRMRGNHMLMFLCWMKVDPESDLFIFPRPPVRVQITEEFGPPRKGVAR